MTKWIVIGVSVVLVIAIAFITAGYIYPSFAATTRDIAIVILAVFQIIGALLLIAILFAILYAIRSINNLAQTSVMPKIDALSSKLDQVLDTTKSITSNVKDTTTTVSTTTTYVAEQVVAPVIRVSGLLAGARAAAVFLARRSAGREG